MGRSEVPVAATAKNGRRIGREVYLAEDTFVLSLKQSLLMVIPERLPDALHTESSENSLKIQIPGPPAKCTEFQRRGPGFCVLNKPLR